MQSIKNQLITFVMLCSGVFLVSALFFSAYTAEATLELVAPVPTGLTAVSGACGVATISISWNSVPGDSISYQLWEDSLGSIIYSGTDTSFVHAVSLGSSYTYTVRATNASQSSAYSNPVTVTAAQVCPPPTPAQPIATVLSTCDGNTTVSWSSVVTAERYNLRYRDAHSLDNPWVEVFAVSAPFLVPVGDGVEVQIQAENVGGTSDWSESAIVIKNMIGVLCPFDTSFEASVFSDGAWSAWTNEPLTIRSEDTVRLRWSNNPYALSCVSDGFDNGGATESVGMEPSPQPTPGSTITYTIACFGERGNETQRMITVTKLDLPNFRSPDVSIVNQVFNSTTGQYDSITIGFVAVNDGGSPTMQSATYSVGIDRDGDGLVEDLVTGQIPGNQSVFQIPPFSVTGITFSNVPFGPQVQIRVCLDTSPVAAYGDVLESNEEDNCQLFPLEGIRPPRPNISLVTTRPIIRRNEVVQINWSISGNVIPMNCSVVGPEIQSGPIQFSTTNTPINGSFTAGPVGARSSYELRCEEPQFNDVFRSEVTVQVVPDFEES